MIYSTLTGTVHLHVTKGLSQHEIKIDLLYLLKGLVLPKLKILSSVAHPHVVPNP